MMKHSIRSPAAAIALCLVLALASPVSAAETPNYMGDMADQIMVWYRLVRNYIAVPILIVSYGAAGFRILSSGFFDGGTRSVDAAKKQIFQSSMAFAVLFLLPSLIMWARNLVESTAWKPASAAGRILREVVKWST